MEVVYFSNRGIYCWSSQMAGSRGAVHQDEGWQCPNTVSQKVAFIPINIPPEPCPTSIMREDGRKVGNWHPKAMQQTHKVLLDACSSSSMQFYSERNKMCHQSMKIKSCRKSSSIEISRMEWGQEYLSHSVLAMDYYELHRRPADDLQPQSQSKEMVDRWGEAREPCSFETIQVWVLCCWVRASKTYSRGQIQVNFE